jgi:hypothetical protein
MTQSDPPGDPLEWLKQLTAGFGTPVSAFDLPRIERQIAEFKAVEGWLDAQLSLLRMAIQSLENQRAAMQVMATAGKDGQPEMPPHPLDMWSRLLQQMQEAATPKEDKK